MYRVVVCDDEVASLDRTYNLLSNYVSEHKINISPKKYSNSRLLIDDLDNGLHYDIYILDIEMPRISGTDIAKKIRQYASEAIIIFVTSHMKYTLESFELAIFRYIPKQTLNDKLPKALKAAFDQLNCQEGKYYLLMNAKRIQKICYKDIIYIYKEEKNSILVLDNQKIKVRVPLCDILAQLPQEDFIQADRCYIVNIRYITKVDGVTRRIVLKNKITVNISKSKSLM